MSEAKEIAELLPKDEKPSIGSVYDDLKERISNPFLFSFGIAFLFTNWRVWVGLLFFDSEKLEQIGCRNHVEYILEVTDNWTLYFWPLIIAAGYSFVFPWFRNFVKWVQAKSITLNNKALNKAARAHVIPVNQYLELEEALENQKDKYSKAIIIRSKLDLEISEKNGHISELNEKITATNNVVTELNSKIAQLNANEKALMESLKVWTDYNDESFFDGLWEVTFADPNSSDVRVVIKNLVVYVYDDFGNSKKQDGFFSITHFAVNVNKKTVIWVNDNIDDGEKSIFGVGIGEFAVFTFLNEGYFEFTDVLGSLISRWRKLKNADSV